MVEWISLGVAFQEGLPIPAKARLLHGAVWARIAPPPTSQIAELVVNRPTAASLTPPCGIAGSGYVNLAKGVEIEYNFLNYNFLADWRSCHSHPIALWLPGALFHYKVLRFTGEPCLILSNDSDATEYNTNYYVMR
jgi:hypothetical protein